MQPFDLLAAIQGYLIESQQILQFALLELFGSGSSHLPQEFAHRCFQVGLLNDVANSHKIVSQLLLVELIRKERLRTVAFYIIVGKLSLGKRGSGS